MSDPVKAPAHYTAYSPLQPIDVCRHLDFNLGNAVKYACRAPFKGGAEDIDKAVRYLEIEERATRGELDFNLGQRKRISELMSKFSKQVMHQDNLSPGYRRQLSVFIDVLSSRIALNALDPFLKEILLRLKTELPASVPAE